MSEEGDKHLKEIASNCGCLVILVTAVLVLLAAAYHEWRSDVKKQQEAMEQKEQSK